MIARQSVGPRPRHRHDLFDRAPAAAQTDRARLDALQQPLQPVEEAIGDRLGPEDADYSAHGRCTPYAFAAALREVIMSRKRRAQPGRAS